MGLAEPLSEFQRFDGLRSIGHGITLELKWPDHPDFPPYGYVVRRSELDDMVAQRAVKAGATLRAATEAIEPLVEVPAGGGPPEVVGAVVHDKETGADRAIRARYVIVADGANSRFGRALGTARNRTYPLGMAIRGYFTSPLHDDPWIESHLDIRDRGWEPFARVRVDFSGWRRHDQRRGRPPLHLHRMEEREHQPPDGRLLRDGPRPVGISPETATCAPTGGRLPTGGSVLPRVGSTYLVVGDAAGSVNPFNGEGISLAYETGRLAADAVDLALLTGDRLALETYSQRLDEVYGLYFKVARTFVRDRQPGRDARAHERRHAESDPHGMGTADHGQPDASRRARARRSPCTAVGGRGWFGWHPSRDGVLDSLGRSRPEVYGAATRR